MELNHHIRQLPTSLRGLHIYTYFEIQLTLDFAICISEDFSPLARLWNKIKLKLYWYPSERINWAVLWLTYCINLTTDCLCTDNNTGWFVDNDRFTVTIITFAKYLLYPCFYFWAYFLSNQSLVIMFFNPLDHISKKYHAMVIYLVLAFTIISIAYWKHNFRNKTIYYHLRSTNTPR